MKKKILVISKGLFHPSLICRQAFKKALNNFTDMYEFTYESTLKGIEKLKDSDYTAVVLFFHEFTLDNSILNILKEYTNNGGSVFAVHGPMASFKTNEEYLKILGIKYTGHGKIEKITVKDANTSFTVKDELYTHEHDPNNKVLFTSSYQGIDEPVMWTRTYGKGKVACFSLGHCPKTFKKEEVRKILFNALYYISN